MRPPILGMSVEAPHPGLGRGDWCQVSRHAPQLREASTHFVHLLRMHAPSCAHPHVLGLTIGTRSEAQGRAILHQAFNLDLCMLCCAKGMRCLAWLGVPRATPHLCRPPLQTLSFPEPPLLPTPAACKSCLRGCFHMLPRVQALPFLTACGVHMGVHTH